MMKAKQKDTYNKSGIGFFLLVSKQYQKVKERCSHCLSAFPSIVTRKMDSLIKKPENFHKFNQYIGTSIKKKNKKNDNQDLTHNWHKYFLYQLRVVIWIGVYYLLFPNRSYLILNRAEAVMAQFFTIFSVLSKKNSNLT